jgi:hypothetical protein
LEQLLNKIEKEGSLSAADMQARAAIAAQLDIILKKFIPGNHFETLKVCWPNGSVLEPCSTHSSHIIQRKIPTFED